MKKLLFLVLLINTLAAKGQVSYIPGPPSKEYIHSIQYLNNYIIKTTSGNLDLIYKYFYSSDNGSTWTQFLHPIALLQRPNSLVSFSPLLFSSKDSFILIFTQYEFHMYATMDFKNLTYLGTFKVKNDTPRYLITNAITGNKRELVGYYDSWLNDPNYDNKSTRAWAISNDFGFTWTDISNGLKSGVDHITGTYNFNNGTYNPDITYHRYHRPTSFISTNKDYFAIYEQGTTTTTMNYDLIRFNFNLAKWEQISGTNFYTKVTPYVITPSIRYYCQKTKTLFLQGEGGKGENCKLYKSSDKGVTWAECGLPKKYISFDVKLFERMDTLFALVKSFPDLLNLNKYSITTNTTTNNFSLYYSVDNGNTFWEKDLAIPKGVNLFESIVSPSGQLVFYMPAVYRSFLKNYGSSVYIEDITGYNFKEDKTSLDNSMIEKLIILNDSSIIVQPGKSNNATSRGLYKTTDKGGNWVNLTKDIPNREGICDFEVKGDTILILAPSVYVSTNGGNSWVHPIAIDSNFSAPFTCIQFIDSNYVLATNFLKDKLYTSTDLVNWQLRIPKTNLTPFESDIFILDSKRYSANSYFSADSGKTWTYLINKWVRGKTKIIFKSQGLFYNFYFKDPTYAIAVSKDTGLNWVDTILPSLKKIKSLIEVSGLLYCNTENEIRIIDKNSLQIIQSINHTATKLLGNTMTYREGKLYISADEGGVFVYDVSTTTGEKETACCANNFSIYPNPANGYVTIENANNETMHCSLLNLAGYEILKRKGNSKLTIETTEVPDGLYIVKLETTKGISYSKILIVH